MKRRILKAATSWREVPFNFDDDLDMFYQLRQDGWMLVQVDHQTVMIPQMFRGGPFEKRLGFKYSWQYKNFELWYDSDPSDEDNFSWETLRFNRDMLINVLPKMKVSPPEFLTKSKEFLICFKKMLPRLRTTRWIEEK